MAIKIVGTSLNPTGPEKDDQTENLSCQGCNTCIEACPTGILVPYYLLERNRCLASTSGKGPGKVVGCDICWVVCPAGIPAT
jgi:epoxyqueuosine reductase QueG